MAISTKEIVAICAIGVAAAAAMAPAVTGSMEQRQKGVCLSNLGTLAQAFNLYLSDNNGRYPSGGGLDKLMTQGQNNSEGAWVWFDGYYNGSGGYLTYPITQYTWRMNPSKGSIWTYTDKHDETYICPADTFAADRHVTSFPSFSLSYFLNCNIVTPACGDTTADKSSPAFRSSVVSPDKTILLAETPPGTVYSSPYLAHYKSRPQFDGVFRWWESLPCARHMGGANFAFCDGHVSWTAASEQRSMVYYLDGNPVTDPKYFTVPATTEP